MFCVATTLQLLSSITGILLYLSVAHNPYMHAIRRDPFPELILDSFDVHETNVCIVPSFHPYQAWLTFVYQYTCYSFRMVISPLILGISPSYFNYTYCNCSYGFYGIPPHCEMCQLIPHARSCIATTMEYDKNYWPVFDPHTGSLNGFLPCASTWETDDAPQVCNPNGACQIKYHTTG